MEQLSRSQRMMVVGIALVLALVCAGLVVYYAVAAPNAPRIKHDALFAVMTLCALLLAWFAWPAATKAGERK